MNDKVYSFFLSESLISLLRFFSNGLHSQIESLSRHNKHSQTMSNFIIELDNFIMKHIITNILLFMYYLGW